MAPRRARRPERRFRVVRVPRALQEAAVAAAEDAGEAVHVLRVPEIGWRLHTASEAWPRGSYSVGVAWPGGGFSPKPEKLQKQGL